MGGLARIMPVTSATSFVASMSISGIPPFNGFFSKLIIIIAAVMARILSACCTCSYSQHNYSGFIPEIPAICILQQSGEYKNTDIREVPFPMVFSMVILSIICVLLSLLVIPEIREAILITCHRYSDRSGKIFNINIKSMI